VADDEEDRARRRLLDDLEERVSARRVEVVGGVDDADAVAALPRRRGEKVKRAADVVDGDLLRIALVVLAQAAPDDREIGMGTGRDLPRRRVLRVDRKRRAAGRRRVAMGEEEARDPIGERRLADALRAADQPGMVKAPGSERIEERRLGLAMAEERRLLARMRRAGELVRLEEIGVSRHGLCEPAP
jgi:hypothetical protein